MLTVIKKSWAILSEKGNIAKNIIRYKEVHFINIKVSALQENIIILNIHAPDTELQNA